MLNKKRSIALVAVASALSSSVVFAEDATAEKEVQDMSDPLAVYTQAGVGATDKGLNLKFGRTYDTGSETTMGMNIVELKGIYGDALGYRDNEEAMYGNVDNSIDSVRIRNFEVDLTNGRGKQIDINYSFDNVLAGDQNIADSMATASYSLMQALPKWGAFQMFPLAGVGLAIGENALDHIDDGEAVIDDGYSTLGSFAVLGAYTKITVTDKIWINYNPMWMTTLSGAEWYKETGFGGSDHVFLNEVAVSYQITPTFNVRYFANWSNQVDFNDGDQRIEINYQF